MARVHADGMKHAGSSPLPWKSYWRMKRAKIPESVIVGRRLRGSALADYLRWRLAMLEAPKYLRLDRVWAGARETLAYAQRSRWEVVVVTLRASRTRLDRQLAQLGLRDAIAMVLSAPAPAGEHWRAKVALAERLAGRLGWFIGDTETDLRAGRALGLRTVGVTCGLRNQRLLAAERPDMIVGSLAAWLRRIRRHPRSKA